MVLKKTKGGPNSGNTFHFAAGMKFHGKYQSVIVKQSRNIRHTGNEAKIRKEAAELVDDGGLSDDHVTQSRLGRVDVYSVEYSLKKRKRWLVPEQIRHGISNGELRDSADKVKFTMAERETVRRGEFQGTHHTYVQKDCHGYYDSSLDDAFVLPTSKYSFETDLKKKGKLRQQRANDQANSRPPNIVQKHNVHFRGIQRPNKFGRKRVLDPELEETTRTRSRGRGLDDEIEDDAPAVHYEICRPRPLSAHSSTHTRHGMEARYDKYKWSKYKVNKSLKKEKFLLNNLKLRTNETAFPCKKWKEEWEEDEELLVELLDEECEEHLVGERTQRAVPSFGDVFEILLAKGTAKSKLNRNTKEKRKSGKKKSPNTAAAFSCNYYGKENVHYINKDDYNNSDTEHGDITDAKNTAVDTNAQMDTKVQFVLPTPFTCLVQSKEILQKDLQSLYNERYMEGQSFPRRFALSIPDDYPSEEPPKTSVLFEVQDSDQCANFDSSVTTLSVALRTTSNNLKAQEALKERITQSEGPVTVEEILVKVKEVLQQPSVRVCASKNATRQIKRQKKFGFLENIRGWNVESSTLYQAYKEQRETLNKKQEQDRNGALVRSLSEIMDDFEILTIPPDCCGICFDSIREEGGDEVKGIAMKPCLHWFCKGCWQHHVTAKIGLGQTTITCPGYECNIKVDPVTLMWLTNRGQYLQLIERDWELVVQASQTLKWCPNVKCGKIVSASVHASHDNRLGPCIECDCGHTWCFKCQREPHYPCTCEQAQVYMKLLKENGDDDELGGAHVYYAKVKRCPSCYIAMEKNGGCPVMTCHCGATFCWECLGKFRDHNFFLGTSICPKVKVEEKVMELSCDYILSLSVQFYQQSVTHRRKRKSWSSEKSIRMATELARKIKCGKSGNQRGFGCEKEISFFEDTYNFTYQAHHLLEYCGVVLSCCRKNVRQMAALDASLRLELIVTHIEEILSGHPVVPKDKIIPTLQKLRNQAENSMSIIISAAGRMQRSISAGRMKSYEEQLNTLQKALA